MNDMMPAVPLSLVYPAAEVRQAFDFHAKLEVVKTLLAQRQQGAVEIGRNLREAKQARKLREFCDALGILTITAEGFILQADIKDGLCHARQKKQSSVPKYTLQEVREMLVSAESLDDAVRAIDAAIAGRT